METITVSDAEADFEGVLERVAAGESFVITEEGRPVARLVGYRASVVDRVGGVWNGRVRIGADFDDPIRWVDE